MDKVLLSNEIKTRLQAAHGQRLRGVVLYGSEARGNASPESDIDVLVLLDGPLDFTADLKRSIHAVYPLGLELGRMISVMPVDADEYETVDCPLYAVAHREGIPA